MKRHLGFTERDLDADERTELEQRARRLRGAILTMTSLAASGHPGGSFSSLETYLLLYAYARLDPLRPRWPERDRVVVSHGHTSPGVYAALADAGFFSLDDAVAHFRQAGSPFEGHVERTVPGVEWSTGNLGQGLSAGVGFALASRITEVGWHTFVAMSDGEQHKGQVAEARRLAAKEGLADLTAIVDLNGIQISGRTSDVMPVDVSADFAADGWGVVEVDGHDVGALYGAIAAAVADTSRPYAVIAHTVIGKGVSFMENDEEFHGRGLNAEEYERAMAELGLDPMLEWYQALRGGPSETVPVREVSTPYPLEVTAARTYEGAGSDNRSAWGAALADIGVANPGVPMAVLDCDLAASVKTGAFAEKRPGSFIQCGVGEHNAAVVAGALSASGVLTFWADFGVFGVDEVYNQHRLSDINEAPLKLALTHCGVDVGEDGKTHQCLDYVGAFRNFFGWSVIVPADPNQTDRAVRAMAEMDGRVAIAMGRSKLPVLLRDDGEPAFAGDYRFQYGRIDRVRDGTDGVVLVMGTPAAPAVEAADLVAEDGLSVTVMVVSAPLDLDDTAMAEAVRAPWILTVEDHGWRTGLFASVAEWMALNGECTALYAHGIEGYQSSGAAADLMRAVGLDADGIAAAIRTAAGA
ncbi:MAG: transketolase [Anaerosomatales bacterium]|nr:transketolase [Anaerosomatales bacterium]